MLKHFLFLMLLLSLTINSFGQRRTWTGYRVYSEFLNRANFDTAKSFVVLDQLEVENHSSGLVEAIKSGDNEMIHFYTKKTDIDSLTLQLIVGYFNNQSKHSITAKEFNLPIRVITTKKTILDKMFNPSVKQGWINFYKKYPNSAGLFKFSKVHFSIDVTKAIFYYSHQQAGLKGRGELVVMEKVNNKWQMKYQFNLWHS